MKEGNDLLNGLMSPGTDIPVTWRPILGLLPYDADNGYHEFVHEGTCFIGVVRDGIPEGDGAIRC
jgi:hypothetical protein